MESDVRWVLILGIEKPCLVGDDYFESWVTKDSRDAVDLWTSRPPCPPQSNLYTPVHPRFGPYRLTRQHRHLDPVLSLEPTPSFGLFHAANSNKAMPWVCSEVTGRYAGQNATGVGGRQVVKQGLALSVEM